MRITVTLDLDVAAALRREVRVSGESFRAVVNDRLRLSLNLPRGLAAGPNFVWREPGLTTGLMFESTSALTEHLDGPYAR
jgi:hypothetical protein